ncbi:MAG: hypothetical protein RJA99_3323 [Pseudomonadota bacterium]|jgi:ABC-type transport system involved in cytochrome c biogenesis ATPase subunit
MRVVRLQLENFRAFTGPIEIGLSAINVLIGANNTGKSSILKALSLMQAGISDYSRTLRQGAESGQVQVHLEDIEHVPAWNVAPSSDWGVFRLQLTRNTPTTAGLNLSLSASGGDRSVGQLPNQEPDHFIIPYLSQRKTAGYSETVNALLSRTIQPNLSNMSARLSRVSNASYPYHEAYRTACEKVLGFMIAPLPSDNGHRPGVYLPDGSEIPIDQMGDGIPHIAGLLVELAVQSGRLFLIEEPENDLHPSALRALLDLIVQSAARNQFVISTHSNIVLSHLGAVEGTRLYSVEATHGRLPPDSTIREIDPTPAARLEVLAELGYRLSDLELWEGWLFLEEASAERIVRDYLIPMFAPGLSRVRTLSTQGVTNIEPSFADFDRLVRFSHLQSVYRDSTWVIADGDEDGHKAIDSLRSSYRQWNPDRFRTWSQPQFERYYPDAFGERIEAVLAITDRKKRRLEKEQLGSAVRAWLDEDPARAKAALEHSAAEVIGQLRQIDDSLRSRPR